MIKHCSYCHDYGEVTKCCSMVAEICPVCHGESNPRIAIARLEKKVDELTSKLVNN